MLDKDYLDGWIFLKFDVYIYFVKKNIGREYSMVKIERFLWQEWNIEEKNVLKNERRYGEGKSCN